LELGPTELLGSAAPMTVRASDVAFRDLQLNDRPGALADHPRDRLSLQRRFAMIELKDDRLCLAAVNAGVSDEIVEDLLTALFSIGFPLCRGALQIRGTIPPVVFSRVRCLARPAFRLSRSTLLVLDRELAHWLGQAARATHTRREIGQYCNGDFFQLNKKWLPDDLPDGGRTPQQLFPAKLLCGLSPVAIGAPHIAFLDLSQHLRPGFRRGEPSDLVAFGGRIPLVEIKNYRIGLAAVVAGMIQEVGEE
jgi:hypothetical protein